MISTAIHFVVAIGVVGGMLWGAAILARRFGSRGTRPGPAGPGLRIVARHPVSKSTSLVRVSVEDRDLLIGTSPKGIELLCDLPKTAPAEIPSTGSAPLLSPGIFSLFSMSKRPATYPGRGAGGYSLVDPGAEKTTPGGFSGVLQAAASRLKAGSRC